MNCRVLHIADFSAPYPGAFIRQLRMLAEELHSRGAGNTAFAFPERAAGAAWLEELREAGHPIVLLGEPSLWRPLSAARRIRAAIRELSPDIVHTHFGSYDPAASLACSAPMGQAGRTPILIWHYRTAVQHDIDNRPLIQRAKDLVRYRIAGARVAHAIGVTEALGREAAIRGMGTRATAVVAGCDTERFRADDAARRAVRAELGISDDEVVLLHLGWAWHRKGGDLLADAAALLRKDGIAVRALSVGAPADELREPVEALPFTEDIQHYHAAADIFVSASRSEGFGNGLVEAMACERVAVAALVEGQREIFAAIDGVAAVTPGSGAALADGIRDLIDRRARWNALGAANRTHIEQHYSMRRWARELADFYADALPAAVSGSGTGTPPAQQEAAA